ncbi:MAG TPA: M13-type metalloendopeptidase [Candidatus Lumbricidophila sp.]|nr:M13-type metalloendopeptidase [Candidatus Lumbricidophila sp.]
MTVSGLTLDELDPAVRPNDDLFRHVNGRWIERTEIPADKARWGSFMVLHEAAEAAVRQIIIEAQQAEPGTEERKVGDLYASFMNEQRANLLGVAPIAAQLLEVSLVNSIDSLLRLLGEFERQGVSGWAQLFVDNDPGDPERYLVFVEQGGIGLPDESYFREERFAPIREAYRAFIERMLGLAQLDNAAARADRIFALETAIAAVHWNNVDCRDSEKTYNPTQWAEFVESAGASGASIDGWRDAMGIPDGAFDTLVVRQPSFVAGLGALLTADRLPAWRDWLAWQVIRGAAPYLSAEFVDANFDFYGRTLSGTPQIRDRWKRGVSLVEGVLGEAVGRVYVERHFPAAAKTEMDTLVQHLIEAYRQSISNLEWMSPETRTRALDKLAKFTPKIGYPVKWRDYSSLAIDANDLIGNVRAAADFEFHRELRKIGSPIDRDEWFMTPQTINAYYNPGFNEIVFPAAILQYPFFTPDRDPAANYGAIGAVIGHEIGHGFDDQGSKYDGDGRLTDWWTEADRAAFEARTAALIAQYDALVPAQLAGARNGEAEAAGGAGDAGETAAADSEGGEAEASGAIHVNGALTIGENIGDLGGLAIAWKAYEISLGGSADDAPEVDGLTARQRFFIAWAEAWQMKARDAEVERLLAIDPHSPNEFRCNQIVRNVGEFYTAFGVTPEDKLWLDESERVSIW